MTATVPSGKQWEVERILKIFVEPTTGEEMAVVNWKASSLPISKVDKRLVEDYYNKGTAQTKEMFTVNLASLLKIDPEWATKLAKFFNTVVRPTVQGVDGFRAFVDVQDQVIVEWKCGSIRTQFLRSRLDTFLRRNDLKLSFKVTSSNRTFIILAA